MLTLSHRRRRPDELDRELNAFKSGFEYVVAHANPPEMFIIHRRDVRPDGRRDQVSGIYWILQDRVYPTPTLYDIMASRTVGDSGSITGEEHVADKGG